MVIPVQETVDIFFYKCIAPSKVVGANIRPRSVRPSGAFDHPARPAVSECVMDSGKWPVHRTETVRAATLRDRPEPGPGRGEGHATDDSARRRTRGCPFVCPRARVSSRRGSLPRRGGVGPRLLTYAGPRRFDRNSQKRLRRRLRRARCAGLARSARPLSRRARWGHTSDVCVHRDTERPYVHTSNTANRTTCPIHHTCTTIPITPHSAGRRRALRARRPRSGLDQVSSISR